MASLIHLDTHVVAWLAERGAVALSPRAQASIEGAALLTKDATIQAAYPHAIW